MTVVRSSVIATIFMLQFVFLKKHCKKYKVQTELTSCLGRHGMIEELISEKPVIICQYCV